MVGETGFEPATPWSRKGVAALAPVSPEYTERQAADFVEPRDPPGSHATHAVAPDRDAWTAGGLRAGATPLPAPGAELFLQAGAIVAERAVRGAGSRFEVEAILRRASDQAALLLRRTEVAGAHP
jgi:hypothetical protein